MNCKKITGFCILLGTLWSCDEAKTQKTFNWPKFDGKERSNISQADCTLIKRISFKLDSIFDALSSHNSFNGSVLVAKKNVVYYSRNFGIADKENKISISDSSCFQLASVSKTFTATAILILIERGIISLDDPVQKFFPEFPYQNIFVKNLLCHRSGLPNYIYFIPAIVPKVGDTLDIQKVIKLMCVNKPPSYLRPNVRFNYSNTNYVLLAGIVEKASQQEFKNFVKKEILEKAGMTQSCFYDEMERLIPERRTVGYTFSMKKIDRDRYDNVYGDKGVCSTTHDIFKFCNALFNGKILKKETLEMALEPRNKEKKTANYGFGWRMRNFDSDHKLVFHNGWWHGYRTAMQRRISDGSTVVILSNRLNSSVYQTWKIFGILDDKQVNDTTGVALENDEE